MKGNQKVVETLIELLAGELTAVDQYFIHSRMYDDWGLTKLHDRLEHEREEETQHADKMIRRILFLEGVPDMVTREKIRVGSTVPEMLQNDLALEYQVIENLKKAVVICEEEKDFQTREVLVKQLEDSEEDHAYWLEKQLGLIDKIGLENYLQSMV